jgi:hypothetical protein
VSDNTAFLKFMVISPYESRALRRHDWVEALNRESSRREMRRHDWVEALNRESSRRESRSDSSDAAVNFTLPGPVPKT